MLDAIEVEAENCDPEEGEHVFVEGLGSEYRNLMERIKVISRGCSCGKEHSGDGEAGMAASLVAEQQLRCT